VIDVIPPAYTCRFAALFLFAFLAAVLGLQAQTADPAPASQNDPLARPRKARKAKTESAYKKWLEEDVKYIITPEEESAFRKLSNDSERENFIETFWRHRDPTPDTQENEFKEEHYRRLTYANEHFSAGVAGSRTDRGRVYIIHGPPDSIESHPMGGPYQRPAEEGGGSTSTYPFEVWRYRNLDGIGQEVEIEFVDTCGCGAYHITTDPGEKDVLAKVPNAGPTLKESMGLDSKANRGRNGFDTLGSSFFGDNSSKKFDKLAQSALLLAPPPLRFKDLKEIVDIKLRYNVLPFDARIDFVRGSVETTLVPVTVQVANRNLAFAGKDGVQHASVNIYGRVTTLGDKIVSTFEDSLRLDVPAELLPRFIDNVSLYQQALPLRPGRYRLDLVLKDVNGDKLGTLYQSLSVPDLSNDEKLTTSSLILADKVEPVPARETGRGPFVIGQYRVRPRVPINGEPAVFHRGEKVNLWMQIYNLPTAPQAGAPPVKAVCRVVDLDGGSVYESLDELSAGAQATYEKTLPSEKLAPGKYAVTVTVRNPAAQESASATAKFAIK
jgi:GWxTD domain-containing protein